MMLTISPFQPSSKFSIAVEKSQCLWGTLAFWPAGEDIHEKRCENAACGERNKNNEEKKKGKEIAETKPTVYG